jgi:hypothetical protein
VRFGRQNGLKALRICGGNWIVVIGTVEIGVPAAEAQGIGLAKPSHGRQ